MHFLRAMKSWVSSAYLFLVWLHYVRAIIFVLWFANSTYGTSCCPWNLTEVKVYTSTCFLVTYVVHVDSSFLLAHCVQYCLCKFVFPSVSCVFSSKHWVLLATVIVIDRVFPEHRKYFYANYMVLLFLLRFITVLNIWESVNF